MVGQTVLIGPLSIAEDTKELIGVGRLNCPQSILQLGADVLAGFANGFPVGVLGDLKAMGLGKVGISFIATRFLERLLDLFVEYVAQSFIEQQRKNELLVIASVDVTAQ